MSNILWTVGDAKAAQAESWVLSQRSDGYWQIQKYDGSTRFESDLAAQAHVRAYSQDHHNKAWELHATKWRTTRDAALEFLRKTELTSKKGEAVEVCMTSTSALLEHIANARKIIKELL